MAKGQKRSGREVKKPKASKTVTATSSPFQQKPAPQSPPKSPGK